MSAENARPTAEKDALVEVRALADRWAAVLDECKATDPRWILDRSVMTLDTALTELRAALNGTRPIPPDEPTVCIAHGRFIPCRKDGEHRYTSNPYWVKSVRDYQGSTDEALTWEPAWERVNPPAATERGQS